MLQNSLGVLKDKFLKIIVLSQTDSKEADRQLDELTFLTRLKSQIALGKVDTLELDDTETDFDLNNLSKISSNINEL